MRFASLIAELRPFAPKWKWIRTENLHITLKFIGAVRDERRATIEAALATVRSRESMTLLFHGLGFFPSEKRPRVLWAGIAAPPALPKLAAGIDHALHQLGLPLETRAFSPHLTLARAGEAQERLPETFLQTVKSRGSADFGALHTSEFHLVESKLKPSGAEYTTLRAFRFVDAP